jgi:hypothetical protein
MRSNSRSLLDDVGTRDRRIEQACRKRSDQLDGGEGSKADSVMISTYSIATAADSSTANHFIWFIIGRLLSFDPEESIARQRSGHFNATQKHF